MTTALIPLAQPTAIREGVTVRAAHRVKRAMRRRAGRIEAILFVLVVLLPQLITALFGGD